MKEIKYRIRKEYNIGTEEEPGIVERFVTVTAHCKEESLEETLVEARERAYGEITVEDIPDSTEEQIAALKAQLESTDYKIIKCSEAQLVGEELPYDIAALHSERQALRDRINELESEGEGA